MSLIVQLEQQVKDAMLARDSERRDALRLILASLRSAMKELQRPLSGDEELQVLQRERKKRVEAIEAYEAAGGGPVDPDAVRWWEVLGTWKWGIMCVMQAEAHRSGTVRSHELAAIGRRVCENEYDLFLALEGRW